MRIGWIEAGKYFNKILKQKIACSLASNEITQLTLAHYLASGKYPRHLRKLNNAIKHHVEAYTLKVLKYFPEGTRISAPRGGFVIWVEPEDVDTNLVFPKALKKKISFTPGSIFTSQERYNNCMRLNCGYPMDDRIEKGIKTLGELCAGAMN